MIGGVNWGGPTPGAGAWAVVFLVGQVQEAPSLLLAHTLRSYHSWVLVLARVLVVPTQLICGAVSGGHGL